MTKKDFIKFNKDVETMLFNAGANVIKHQTLTEFYLPTYYGIQARFALHTEYTRGDKVFTIFGNTNYCDSNIRRLFDIASMNNTKTNIHTFNSLDALEQLEYKIKALQTNPVL